MAERPESSVIRDVADCLVRAAQSFHDPQSSRTGRWRFSAEWIGWAVRSSYDLPFHSETYDRTRELVFAAADWWEEQVRRELESDYQPRRPRKSRARKVA